MNRKKAPRLEEISSGRVRSMIRKVGINWVCRLRASALKDRNIWLREIKSVGQECILIHHNLSLQKVPAILKLISNNGVIDFMKIFSDYDMAIRRQYLMNTRERYIYENICSEMMKSILFSSMTSFNIGASNCEFVHGILIKLLHVIPKLRILILPALHHVTNMPILKERIRILSCLQELVFNLGCTSEIIIELSKYCPLMKKISVERSSRVDDICVEHLLKLRSLISLNIAGTSISPNGYAIVLSGLPQLEDITCFYPIDNVIKYLNISLPSVRKFTGVISAGKYLVETCPNITELILISFVNCPTGLEELEMVADLTIKQAIYDVFRLSPLITRLGPTLTSLKLFQVVDISMEDIFNYCTSLNHLSITQCRLTGSPVVLSRELEHFRNVKDLRLLQNEAAFEFSEILQLYDNLNMLYVTGMKELTDELVVKMIRIGGFRNLNEFVAERSGDLSLRAAILLMHKCPHLTLIGNLSRWPCMSSIDIHGLIDYVKEENLSLILNR